jgi:hypothetical protein
LTLAAFAGHALAIAAPAATATAIALISVIADSPRLRVTARLLVAPFTLAVRIAFSVGFAVGRSRGRRHRRCGCVTLTRTLAVGLARRTPGTAARTDERHVVGRCLGTLLGQLVLLFRERGEVVGAATRRTHGALRRRTAVRTRGRAHDCVDEIGFAHAADRFHAQRRGNLGELLPVLRVQLGTVEGVAHVVLLPTSRAISFRDFVTPAGV